MKPVVVDRKDRRAEPETFPRDPNTTWTIIAVTGLAVALVGWSDLALLWLPWRFGNVEWQFSTISAHFDAMPLGTVGYALLAAGLVGHGRRRATRVLAYISVLVTAALMVIAAIYLLDVPVVLERTAPEIQPILKKAMLKGGLFALTYTVLYGWFAWFLLKSTAPSVRSP